MVDPLQQQTDRAAIENLVVRERAARDAGLYAEMADCFHEDSRILVSWFDGTGRDFAAATERMAATGKLYTFHQMGASAVTQVGDRALVDSNCTIHGISTLDGAEVDLVSHGRLMWRVRRDDGIWLIAGMQGVYIRDCIVPLNPLRLPALDEALLGTFRSSYRYIAYSMARAGRQISDELPGVDRPETVLALRMSEQRWLRESH